MNEIDRILEGEDVRDVLQEEEIDAKKTKEAVLKAAKEIFKDKTDEKIVDSIVKNAITKAKDTEDAIQIGINMLRSK